LRLRDFFTTVAVVPGLLSWSEAGWPLGESSAAAPAGAVVVACVACGCVVRRASPACKHVTAGRVWGKVSWRAS
jgi:hypothetical protein